MLKLFSVKCRVPELADHLQFMGMEWENIVPESDYETISRHYAASGRIDTYYGLLQKYIIHVNKQGVWFDKSPNYWTQYVSNNQYVIKERINVNVYLCDCYPDEATLYDKLKCFPLTIKDNEIVINGKWILYLHQYIESIGVNRLMIENRAKVDEAIAYGKQRSDKEHDVCCGIKRSILDGWGK